MKTLAILLLAALAVATSFADESAHDRAVREQFEQLQKDLSDISKAPDRDKKLAEIQRRFDKLQIEMFDLTKGESSVCSVHHLKMSVKEVPIAYGLQLKSGPAPEPETRTRKFPFAQDKILGGCFGLSVSTGRVFVCSRCVEAEKAWMDAHQR